MCLSGQRHPGDNMGQEGHGIRSTFGVILNVLGDTMQSNATKNPIVLRWLEGSPQVSGLIPGGH